MDVYLQWPTENPGGGIFTMSIGNMASCADARFPPVLRRVDKALDIGDRPWIVLETVPSLFFLDHTIGIDFQANDRSAIAHA